MRQEDLDRFSVLITAYRNADLVKRCLDSLVASCGGVLPETVVVDDAAGDPDTRTVVESYARYGVKFAVMPQNGGFAGANNFGLPLCTKEFVTLVNTDIVFRESPFPSLLAFMDQHPKAGVAQCSILVKNGQPGVDGMLNGCGAFLTPLGTMSTLAWLKPADDPVAQSARRCFAAYGAMFMIRRAVVASTGRLFYDFFHTYYEEVDFCHRSWLAGWEVWYVPTPFVEHAHGATMGKFYTREDILRKYYRNIRFSLRTCLGLRGRLTLLPVFEFGCFAQTVLQLLKGKGVAFRAHRWARAEIRRLRPAIESTRREIQRRRVISDTALFKIIMRKHTLGELFSAVRGNL